MNRKTSLFYFLCTSLCFFSLLNSVQASSFPDGEIQKIAHFSSTKHSSLNDEEEEAALFLKSLPRIDDSIDLTKLSVIPGGGTHNIYRPENSPFILKVMKNTIGDDEKTLCDKQQELADEYAKLYAIFTPSNCLVESRFIDSVTTNGGADHNRAIVSIVKYDSAFESQDKFGFNVHALERDETILTTYPIKYHQMNASLLGMEDKASPLNYEDYLLFQPSFARIFDLIENDSSLREEMIDFLMKCKSYYKETDRLMDFKGKDNVLFYKSEGNWHYKVGSVLKHETGQKTRTLLKQIDTNPDLVNKSFENRTSIFYALSWARALNAVAQKLQMERIVDDIIVTAKESEVLSKIYSVLPLKNRVYLLSGQNEFQRAKELFNAYLATEDTYNTAIRDTLSTRYWNYINTKQIDAKTEDVVFFLGLLTDPRNEFPDHREKIVTSAQEGLKAKLAIDS